MNRLKKSFEISLFILFVLLFFNPYGVSYLDGLSFVTSPFFAPKMPLNTLYCFWFGVTLFYAMKKNKQNLYCLLLVVIMLLSQFQWYSYPITALLLIYVCINSENIVKRERQTKIIAFLSKGSFDLYLCHPVVLAVTNLLCNMVGIRGALKAFIICISIFASAYGFYYLVQINIEGQMKKMLYRGTQKKEDGLY